MNIHLSLGGPVGGSHSKLISFNNFIRLGGIDGAWLEVPLNNFAVYIPTTQVADWLGMCQELRLIHYCSVVHTTSSW